MTYTNEQFEQVLDDALTLARAGKSNEEILQLFPEYANELREFLTTATAADEHFVAQNARASLKTLLNKIPESTRAKKNSRFSFTFQRPFAYGFAVAALVLAIGINIVFTNKTKNTGASRDTGITTMAGVANQPSVLSALLPDNEKRLAIYVQPKPEKTIADVREYIKTSVNATIATRDIADTLAHTLVIIHGYGGRADSYSSDKENGYIEFVIPKINFDKFKADITELAGTRFIEVSESGQNMLGSKIAIERQDEFAHENKTDAENNRAAIISHYDAVLSSLNAQIAFINTKITTASDVDRSKYISERNALEKKRAAQESEYSQKLSEVNQQISDLANEIETIKDKNQNLDDTVATVSGTIVLHRINWFGVLTAYIPVGWLIAIGVTALLIYRAKRKRRLDE